MKVIPVTDFRLGNHIQMSDNDKNLDKYWNEVVTTQVLIDIESSHYSAYGIPLTRKILEKFGFKKMELRPQEDTDWLIDYDLEGVNLSDYNVFYKLTGDFILGGLRDDDKSWQYVYENAGYDEEARIYTMGQPIDYLHQLQNLYFALCGTELLITI